MAAAVWCAVAALFLQLAATPGELATASKPEVNIMQVNSNRNFYFVVLLPVHSRGSHFLSCGAANDSEVLFHLTTLASALNQSNDEALLRTGITVGLLLMDYCQEPLKAVDFLYRLVSSDAANKNISHLTLSSVVALVTVERVVTTSLRDLTHALQIPHIESLIRLEVDGSEEDGRGRDDVLPLTVSTRVWLRAVVDFLRAAKVDTVAVVYSDNPYGKRMRGLLDETLVEGGDGICIAEIHPMTTGENGSVARLAATMASRSDGRVIVVLSDLAKSVKLFLSTYGSDGGQGMLLVNDDLVSLSEVGNSSATLLSVGLGPQDLPLGVRQYVSQVSPSHPEAIPVPWLTSLWEEHFRCSFSAKAKRRDACSDQAQLNDSVQASAPALHRLYLAVHAASVGLQDFLTRHCPQRDEVFEIDGCGKEARGLLLEETRRALFGDARRGQRVLLANSEGSRDILFILQMPNAKRRKLASWKNGAISATEHIPSTLRRLGIYELPCVETCAEACPSKASIVALTSVDPAANFRETWGWLSTGLSILGMAVVAACFAYFVAVIPNQKGTTLLGYVILVGIFLVYSSNFAFVAVASESSCTTRRLLMGVAYALVYSAKLVKVVNVWRRTKSSGSPAMSPVSASHNQQQPEANPTLMVLIPLTLTAFQAGIAIAWLIMSPPSTVLVNNSFPLCQPGAGFEAQLVLSFLYVLVLMLLAAVFSVLTWRSEVNSRESQWIFVSTAVTGLVWVVWASVAARAEADETRSVPIVSANLVCATVTLLCLFSPKLYLYSSLLRQAKMIDIHAFYPSNFRRHHHPPAVSSLYDPLHHNNSVSSYSSINGGRLPSSQLNNRNNDKQNHHQPQQLRPQVVKGVPVRVVGVPAADRPRYDGGSQFQAGRTVARAVSDANNQKWSRNKPQAPGSPAPPPSSNNHNNGRPSRNVEYF